MEPIFILFATIFAVTSFFVAISQAFDGRAFVSLASLSLCAFLCFYLHAIYSKFDTADAKALSQLYKGTQGSSYEDEVANLILNDPSNITYMDVEDYIFKASNEKEWKKEVEKEKERLSADLEYMALKDRIEKARNKEYIEANPSEEGRALEK